MTEEKFRELFDDDISNIKTVFPDGDNALMGLNIISKYLPKSGIEAAGHDIIYSVDVDEIVNAGITEEDATTLKRWNWMIDSDCDCLACFV